MVLEVAFGQGLFHIHKIRDEGMGFRTEWS